MSGTVAVPAARTQQLAAAVPEVVFFAGVFVATAALAAANGGYFPTSWGWSGIALFWAAAAALILRDARRGSGGWSSASSGSSRRSSPGRGSRASGRSTFRRRSSMGSAGSS